MENKNAHIFLQKQTEVKKALVDLVTMMGVEAKNHFTASFRNQGFTDTTLEPWQKRKEEDEGRAVLTKTGDLKRSIKVIKNSISNDELSVTLESDLPYAQIHNEGGEGLAFGKYRFKMPKREFMGDSVVLINKIKSKIQQKISNLFK